MTAQEMLASHSENQQEERGWERPRPAKSNRFKQAYDRTPLRTKLIASVLVLLIMALAAISVASSVLLKRSMITQRDTELQGYFNAVASVVDTTPINVTPGEAKTLGNGIVGIQLPGHQLSWEPVFGNPSVHGAPEATLPALPRSTSWAAMANPVTVTLPSQSGPDTWRAMAAQVEDYPVPVPDSTSTTDETVNVVVAVDLGDINALSERLVLFDLIVGGAIVLILATVGATVVRSSLRPLDDIELTAGQIAAGHLDHRVPEGDPRTEIGSLGRSLNAMLAHIERAFNAQQEAEQTAHESEERMRRFIADAAHELRTPLTTIRGFAAHYRLRGGGSRLMPAAVSSGSSGSSSTEETAGGSSGASVPAGVGAILEGLSAEELDHLMGRVESEATRMGMLVEDLLTLARLDQQRPLNIGPVDVLTLAADAVQDARIVQPGRSIDLIVAPGTAFLIDGDEPRLRQVLANLVNNAITHTPAGTPIRVKIARGTLDAAERSGQSGQSGQEVPVVTIDVEDDGPGMTAEQAQRVFERFYRADAARNRASGGTGLGLAIVAGLVSAHGGAVSVHTEPGKGADFRVKLPLSPDVLATDGLDEDDEPGDELA
jgi:two-component system, OmpR family, sensor kinase